MIYLFQGDSVTDCGWDRGDMSSLGGGYVKRIADILREKYPDTGATILNRGVGGNRISDLAARWEEDCLRLEPKLLTILIGINDCWRRFDSNDPTTVEDFEKTYREIISRACSAVPGIEIIIMEPFMLPVTENMIRWREDLDPKIHAARRIAVDLKCGFVPLDGIFAQAAAEKGYAFLAVDGVHPTDEGHKLIAEAWTALFAKRQSESISI